MQKNVTTIVEVNIAAYRGYICMLNWLKKFITKFLMFQKDIQTISIGFEYSTFHFDEVLWQNWGFCTKIDVNLDSDFSQKPTIAHEKA